MLVTRASLVALVLLSVHPAVGQEPPVGSPLRALVDTERAFSRMSVEQGTRPAFLAFFADDGVNFAPQPVNTKATLSSQPAPATPPNVMLEWVPVTADVARAGDLGYTTGPFVRTERSEARKPLAWGWYFTVWKKQADGSWKVVADIGTATPTHVLPGAEAFHPANVAGQPGASSAPAPAAGATEILAAEQKMSELGANGALDAYLTCGTPGIRLHRSGAEPVVGAEAVRSFLADKAARITSKPLKADVSRSGDLGYAYGSYVASFDKAGSPTEERGFYLRVWKRLSDGWRLVADITSPEVPKSQPSN